jgi:hypothetical protein
VAGVLNLFEQKNMIQHLVVQIPVVFLVKTYFGSSAQDSLFVGKLGSARPTIVNALIRLVLPCRRHIVKLSPPP